MKPAKASRPPLFVGFECGIRRDDTSDQFSSSASMVAAVRLLAIRGCTRSNGFPNA
jgi:hypothetical protein